MEFWKEHAKLRVALIAVLFVTGIAAAIYGWRLTGALWIYNMPFERPHKKRP